MKFYLKTKNFLEKLFYISGKKPSEKLSFKKMIKTSFKAILFYQILKRGFSQIYCSHEINFNKQSLLNNYLVKSILPIDYKPTIYMLTCLSQMIYNENQQKKQINYKRQYVATHDLGVISLDWVVTKSTQSDPLKYENLEKDDKLLVIMHGLTGGSESNYIRDIIAKLSEVEKLKIVVVNYRGISDSPLLTPFTYHIGYYNDLLTAMEFIRERYPDLRCYALGTSMGANLFCKLLANHHEYDNYIKGFINISNPFNAFEVEKRNRNGVLDYFLAKRKVSYLEEHKYAFDDFFDYEKLKLIKNYRDYDMHFTCKIFGFETVEDYYHKCSCYHELNHIKIPTIFFNSKNDKMSPIDSIDKKTCNFLEL